MVLHDPQTNAVLGSVDNIDYMCHYGDTHQIDKYPHISYISSTVVGNVTVLSL